MMAFTAILRVQKWLKAMTLTPGSSSGSIEADYDSSLTNPAANAALYTLIIINPKYSVCR